MKDKKYNKKLHKHLGRKTVHHLIPRARLKDYYGTSFKMPRNRLKLWELKHSAWHVLFKNKTINEVIAYLRQKGQPYGYHGDAWKLLFKNKTKKQAARLLVRLRRIIRKRYQHLEFDPSLRTKVFRLYKKQHRPAGQYYLAIKFAQAA